MSLKPVSIPWRGHLKQSTMIGARSRQIVATAENDQFSNNVQTSLLAEMHVVGCGSNWNNYATNASILNRTGQPLSNETNHQTAHLYYYKRAVIKKLSSKCDGFLAGREQFDSDHGVDLYAPTCCQSATVRPLFAFYCPLFFTRKKKIMSHFARDAMFTLRD